MKIVALLLLVAAAGQVIKSTIWMTEVLTI